MDKLDYLAEKCLSAFLDYEISEYAFGDVEITGQEMRGDSFYAYADWKEDDGLNTVYFKLSDIKEPDEGDDWYSACNIEVELGGAWHECKWYDSSVKHFWMTALSKH